VLFLRKILFYLFILVYIVLCPLTVLYALGYLFRPGVEQGIVKTGLVYLSTAPPGASVYIGKRRYNRKTPAILRDLLPGNYPIKLFLKDRELWEQIVPVEAEKATALEKILLLPKELKREELLSESFEDLIPIEGDHFFLLTKGPKVGDIFVCNWKDKKSWPFVSDDFPYRGAKVLSFFTRKDSPFLFLQVKFQESEKYLWADLRGKGSEVEDLTALFPERPLRIEWDFRERKHVFAFYDGYLNQMNAVSKSVHPRFLENIRGFGLFNKWIYFLKDNAFQRVDYEGKNKESLFDDSLLIQSLFGGKGFFDIKILSKDLILFWGEKGELLASRLPYRFIEDGVMGFEFYPPNEQVLLWQKNKLGILDFSREPKKDEVFEKGPKLVWIYKQAEKIEQAFWVFGGSHILFRDDDKVYLIELETYGKPILRRLLQVKKKSSVFYSEESGKLYYLESATGHLSSVEILPRREILLLPFPERKEEKKRSEIQEL